MDSALAAGTEQRKRLNSCIPDKGYNVTLRIVTEVISIS
mgnify:CR=1 FL=1